MGAGSFVLFGTSHILTLLVFASLTAILLHLIPTLSDRGRRRADSCVRWTVVVSTFLWGGLAALTHQFDLGKDLPVAVCSVSTIMLAIYMWRPRKWMFDILFYWVLVGSSLALLLPDLQKPFPSLRFFGMFASHAVNVFTMLYLLVVRGDAPSEGSYRVAFWTLAAYGLGFALPVDALLHANYLFMLSPPAMDFAPLHLLPSWPAYWFVFLAFFYVAFRITHATYFHYAPSDEPSRERYAH